MEKFTQGTMIEHIRSEKYKNIRCIGVVISARCDIAQKKISLFHCLTALQLSDWIYEVLYYVILGEKIKQVRNTIDSFCCQKKLDTETLLKMANNERETVLGTYAKKTEQEKMKETLCSWDELKTMEGKEVERIDKKSFLLREKKMLEKHISCLYNSNFPKYVKKKKKAYSKSDSSVLGIVVDLQDIHQYSTNFIEKMQTYKYDYQTLTDEAERKRINEKFFFEDEEDFVLASDIVESPWIEHLMQKFSVSFIRIGLDNASEYETKDFCKEWLEG